MTLGAAGEAGGDGRGVNTQEAESRSLWVVFVVDLIADSISSCEGVVWLFFFRLLLRGFVG